MQIVTHIECDPEVELVARAMYAHNQCPGRHYLDASWPPSSRIQLSRYLNIAKAVVRAQKNSEPHEEINTGNSVGNEFPNGED